MSSRTKSDSNDQRDASSNSERNHGKRSDNPTKPVKETLEEKEKLKKASLPTREDPIYNVYLCYFRTVFPLLKFEVGLLIATDERIVRKGHYYQVKGPKRARGYKDRLEYHLYYSIFKSPENSMYFRKLAHIGRMRESKLYLPLRIAEQIPPPQVVLSFTGQSPNCIDWMNNFLFELARFKVIDFDTDFEPPPQKKILVHPSLLSPDELVAVGLSPTLSDRYVPSSEYLARSRNKHTNSQSNHHPTSSNQEPPSSKKEPSSKPTTSSSNNASSSSKKPESSTRNEPSSAKPPESSSRNGQSSSNETSSSHRDKPGAPSKSGKIPPSPQQKKEDSKHKHLSIRRFFSKK